MFWFENPNEPYAWDVVLGGVLGADHLNLIETFIADNPGSLTPARIWSDNSEDAHVRNTDVFFLQDSEHFESVFANVTAAVHQANAAHFKYSISYLEPLQFSVYRAETSGHYDIHVDNSFRNPKGNNRKISFSVLLNDPSEFDGGELCLHYTSKPIVVNLQKGQMALFPSYMPHSVQPVTRGVRKSLVGWVCGPNFV
jgi:PKHD-type hydroxylase